jgi:hypothetical protein
MRLQFQLKKINIDPVCHIQILRHAEEFQHHNNIYGQLYGALLDDEAEVTSVMALPDGEKSTKEELEGMEKRNDELLSNFNMDNEKIGWYLVCYTRNFWDSLETIKYYEVTSLPFRTTLTPASSSSSITNPSKKAKILTAPSVSRTSSPSRKTSSGKISRRQTSILTTHSRKSQSKSRRTSSSN